MAHPHITLSHADPDLSPSAGVSGGRGRGPGPSPSPGPRVLTVDSFQGSEAEVIILSFVRNNVNGDVGMLTPPPIHAPTGKHTTINP